MVNFPYYLFSFDFLVADIYLGLQTVIHLLHLPIFTPILVIMLNQCMLLPQYKNALSKAQIPAYFQKILDIPVAAWNTNSATQQLSNSATQQLSNSATQQLSNSAAQQLSNSATQQLRRKGGLCSDKRAAFLFRQQHYYFFSSFFAEGKRTVNLFHIKPQRVPRMLRQIEENIPFKTLASSASLRLIKIKPLRSQRKVEKKFNRSSLFRSFVGSAYFAVTLRTKPVKNVQNSKYSGINLVPHNYQLQIIHYSLFSALYRRSRQAVWFDSG